jgi:hypothetical protein
MRFAAVHVGMLMGNLTRLRLHVAPCPPPNRATPRALGKGGHKATGRRILSEQLRYIKAFLSGRRAAML